VGSVFLKANLLGDIYTKRDFWGISRGAKDRRENPYTFFGKKKFHIFEVSVI